MGRARTPLGAAGKIAVVPIAPTGEPADAYRGVKAPPDVLAWMRDHPGTMQRIAAELTAKRAKSTVRHEASTRYRDSATGRTTKIRARGTTPDKASAALREKLSQRETTRPAASTISASSLIDVLLDVYLESLDREEGGGPGAGARRRPQTLRGKRHVVRRTVRPGIGGIAIGELGAPEVDQFLNSVIRSGRWNEARDSALIIKELLTLSNRLGLTTVSPSIIVPTVPRPSRAGSAEKPVRFLTAEQIDKLRRALYTWHVGRLGKSGPAPDGQPLQILEVMTGAALRPGEAAALVIRNLFIDGSNADHPFIVVDGTIVLREGAPHRQPETKTGRARTVAVPAAAVHAIRQRLAALDEMEGAGKREPRTSETLLFSTRTGSPHQDSNLRRSFGYATDLLDDLGVNVTEFAKIEFTPHMARRSAATAVYHHEDGGQSATIAMLGHQSAAQLPAYVADLGLAAPDFSAIAALDELLPILDQSV